MELKRVRIEFNITTTTKATSKLSHKSAHIYRHAIDDGCPSCVLLQTSALELASRAPDWSALEESRVQSLCQECSVCLVFALRNRLQESLSKSPAVAQREKELAEQLGAAQKEVEDLHEKIGKLETEKVGGFFNDV